MLTHGCSHLPSLVLVWPEPLIVVFARPLIPAYQVQIIHCATLSLKRQVWNINYVIIIALLAHYCAVLSHLDLHIYCMLQMH